MKQAFIQIHPISHPLRGVVRVPGSKSITNRVLLVAALAEGNTILKNAVFCDDSRYFAESLGRLNFKVEPNPEESTYKITGLGGRIPIPGANLFVGNAGTATSHR